MVYGLLAALCWGLATLGAAFAARRIGSFRTVLVGETVALTGYGALCLIGHVPLSGVGAQVWVLLLAGVAGVFGYLALYRGLESGHVGLVSAISASYGGIIVVLSVIFLGESLTPAAAVGVGATVAGVALASTRGAATDGRSQRAAGLAFGLAAAVCYGLSGFLLGRAARDLGWLVPLLVARTGSMATLLTIGALRRPRRPAGPRKAGLAWACAAGLVDAVGLIFFTRGDQVGLVAITAAVSSAYPVVPLLGGLILMRERLLARQIGGVALILAGLVLLGLGS